MFVWLVGRKRILTWDQIQKRGFSCPSRCCLCNQDGEDQEHLLNGCRIAQYQWHKTKDLFSTIERNPQDIIQTLCNLGEGRFKSSVGRRAWNMVAGFNVWKAKDGSGLPMAVKTVSRRDRRFLSSPAEISTGLSTTPWTDKTPK